MLSEPNDKIFLNFWLNWILRYWLQPVKTFLICYISVYMCDKSNIQRIKSFRGLGFTKFLSHVTGTHSVHFHKLSR